MDLLRFKLKRSNRRNQIACLIGLSLVLGLFQNCAPPFGSVDSVDKGELNFSNTGVYASKCDRTAPPSEVQVHRLSNKEYINTIKDLFNVTVTVTEFPMGDKVGPSGYSNDYVNLNNGSYLSDDVIKGYYTLAVSLATRIITSDVNRILALGCAQTTDACFNQIIDGLALRLFRRPLASLPGGGEARSSYLDLIKTKANLQSDGLRLLLSAMLSSPNFLYRTYGTYSPATDSTVQLDRYEIASRLASFLWASAPDIELLNSDLTDPNVQSAQIERMIADPRAARLATIMGDEWIAYSDIGNTDLPEEFGVDTSLRGYAVAESQNFLNHVFVSSPRVLDLFDANYSYLNADLASFYGINGVSGNNLRIVSDIGNQRGGLLGQMSILSASSGGDTDTHPVKRGLWVVNEAMCIEIKDPPAGVDTLPDIPLAQNPRQFADYHSRAPACMGCHVLMDPIGLGLENYNAVGQWQTEYLHGSKWGGKGLIVEPEGNLAGQAFSGPNELKRLVTSDQRTHVCIAQKIMKYAVGRNLGKKDFCVAEQAAKEVVSQDGSFKELVKRIVASDSFSTGGRND